MDFYRQAVFCHLWLEGRLSPGARRADGDAVADRRYLSSPESDAAGVASRTSRQAAGRGSR